MEDSLITVKEVSDYLKLKDQTVYLLARQKKIPSLKIGGSLRFKKSQIDAWLLAKPKKNSAKAGRSKVLIVDDEEEVQDFLASCMQAAGCEQVDTAATGEAALGLSVQQSYDLVTLDLRMPGASGMDVISVIRGMMPGAVIAIVSGYTEEVTKSAREYAGVVLSKPVRLETVHQLVALTRELTEKRDAIRRFGK